MSLCYLLLCVFFGSVFTIEPRVFSADDLRFDVHKYLVKLKVFHENHTGMCSGSILDNKWVITSAHCFKGGEKYVSVFHQTDKGQRIIAKVDPVHIHIHPNWVVGNVSITNRVNDLALLKTTNSIKFSDDVQSIKLSRTFPRSNQSGIIAGFGESETDLEPPREGFVTIDRCYFGIPGLLCSDNTVRAGSGDSGGSLVSNGRLVGVTSASCKNVEEPKVCTTVYVSIAAHWNWIREMLLGK
ncbi:kallikrein-8-like [Ostrinia furnacalis]|uniref:kallikrein-8-like n=1 Tax=Ostrinia furnacalis TaxID=93504 RepID=UPI00103DF3E7|nr:kallikrein-8-like [Ostrinia furnacalis]